MANKSAGVTRDMIIEAKVLANDRGNKEAVALLEGLLARMRRRKQVERGFLTPEEKDLMDWAQTSPAAW